MKSIPNHLSRLVWYAPHQAWIKSQGWRCQQEPEDAEPRRADLRYADLSGIDLRDANLSYANLSYANLRRADLSGIDLRGADLSDANLSYADLCRADLCRADLRRAVLSGADLRGAYLSGADLSGADLRGAKGVATRDECIRNLDEIRTHIIEHGDKLEMALWHSDSWSPETEPVHACETAHCLAGWAQALSPDPEIRQLDPVSAGVRLIPLAVPLFWADNATAKAWLESREYAK